MNETVHNLMNNWLDRYGTGKAGDKDRKERNSGSGKTSWRKMDAQKKIDLHGCTVNEALSELGSFIDNCKKQGIKKILVVHGKGIHSSAGPVLKDEVRKHLNLHPLIGQTGTPGRTEGGSGATWAVIR